MILLLPLFACVLLIGLWTVILSQINQERATALSQASNQSSALAQMLALRTERILQLAAQATDIIKFEYEHHGSENVLPALLASTVLPVNTSKVITLDAEAKVTAGNYPVPSDNFAKTAAFQSHIKRDTGQLYISNANFDGTVREWSIQLSRRLNRPDGSFAGVVLITLPQSSLTDFYPLAGLGQHGSIGLLGSDGAFRALRIGNRFLHPEAGVALPALASVPGRYRSALAANGFDDSRSSVSFRPLNGFPLVVLVGVGEQDVLAKLEERRALYLWSAVCASAVILVFFALFIALLRRRQHSMALAEKAQVTFRAAAEGSLDAFYILETERDGDGRILDFTIAEANQHMAKLIDRSKDQIIGHKLGTLLPSTHIDGFFDKCVAVAQSGLPLEGEFETTSGDGSTRWWHHQWIPIDGGLAVASRDISARKRIEAESRHSHNFLQSLIDYIPTLIYVKTLPSNGPGEMVIWNKAAENATGYKSEQVLGKTIEQIFPAKVAAEYINLIQQMQENPRVIDTPERPFRNPDGKLLYFRTISVPLLDQAGKPEYLLGIGVDITEQRAQQLKLRTKQAELDAANDASPLGLFRTDADGNCTYVNRTYEEMSGMVRAQALGAGWAASIHPQDRLKVFQGWRLSSRSHALYHGTYRFVHADGRIVWASVKMAPVLIDGTLQGYVGNVDDITARRTAEKALAESEQHLRTITDTLPALVAYVDSEQHYRFNNLAYQRVYGVARDAIRGKTIRELAGEALYLRAAPFIARALAGETITFEVDELRQGQYRCWDLTYTPQFDDEEAHRVVGFHVMGHDITAKKVYERRLVELTESDSLTGLLNRTGFQKKLNDAMAESRKSGGLMAVIYMDIDHFKQVNDSYGHPIGDALLKSFVARLSRTLRATDSVARLGGDEFTIVMENLSRPEDVVTIVKKIGEAMRPAFSLEEHTVAITVSLGVAYYQGGPQNPDTLLKQADDALYLAKKAGRNTYRIAPPDAVVPGQS